MSDSSPRRTRAVERVRNLLRKQSDPGPLMLLVLIASGASGFLFSALLLHWGVERMGVRYPLAVLLAYGVFLFLLWLWLVCHPSYRRRRQVGQRPLLLVDQADPEVTADLAQIAVARAGVPAPPPPASGAKSSGLGDLGEIDGDALPIVVVLLVLTAVVALLAASFYVLFLTPVLLAEVIADGIILARLARRRGGNDPWAWLNGPLRHTWWPLVMLVAVMGGVGFLLDVVTPEARTMGEALERAFNRG